MISVEQIRRLDARVQQAVNTISSLKGENSSLREKLAGYERRIEELEQRLSELAEGQSELERGVLSALNQLDSLEDQLFDEPAGTDDKREDATISDAPAEELDIF